MPEEQPQTQSLAQRITSNWYARAERLEDYYRDFAFLGLTEELRFAGGKKVEVRLLTLRMFVQLCAVRSPFLVGGRVGPEHIAQILWRLSPEYDRRQAGGAVCPDRRDACLPDAAMSVRQRFVASIADIPFKSGIRTVSRYLDRMLIDKPPSSTEKTGAKSDTSFAAGMVHELASAYGWTDDAILDLPMPRLFQYLRKIYRAGNPELLHFHTIKDRFVKHVANKIIEQRQGQRAEGEAQSAKDFHLPPGS